MQKHEIQFYCETLTSQLILMNPTELNNNINPKTQRRLQKPKWNQSIINSRQLTKHTTSQHDFVDHYTGNEISRLIARKNSVSSSKNVGARLHIVLRGIVTPPEHIPCKYTFDVLCAMYIYTCKMADLRFNIVAGSFNYVGVSAQWLIPVARFADANFLPENTARN